MSSIEQELADWAKTRSGWQQYALRQIATGRLFSQGAPVSTPLHWDELTEDVTPRRFGMRETLERVERHGDLFEPVLAGGQALGRALRKVQR